MSNSPLRRLTKNARRATLIAVVIVGLLVGMLLFLVRHGKRQREDIDCKNKLRQLAVGALLYEAKHGTLPMGIETGPNGQRLHSWRIQVRSFFDAGHYDYHFDQAWDCESESGDFSVFPESNLAKGSNFVWANPYVCVLDEEDCIKHSQVSYLAVFGEQTAFPINRAVELDEITDGMENTILFVETLNSRTKWTEPMDLDFNTMSMKINDPLKPSVSSRHPGGANVVFVDGATYFVTEKITPAELRALLTIAGGENVTRRDLEKRGVIR